MLLWQQQRSTLAHDTQALTICCKTISGAYSSRLNVFQEHVKILTANTRSDTKSGGQTWQQTWAPWGTGRAEPFSLRTVGTTELATSQFQCYRANTIGNVRITLRPDTISLAERAVMAICPRQLWNVLKSSRKVPDIFVRF
jgi:hypothetical protein